MIRRFFQGGCWLLVLSAFPAAAQDGRAEPGTASDPNMIAFNRAVADPSIAAMPAAERLLAIEEIKQVTLRYARCLSQKDEACFRALFHPDLPYSYAREGESRSLQGGAAMVAMMRDRGPFNGRVSTVVHSHGAEVELLSPTRARAVWAANSLTHHVADNPQAATGLEMIAPGDDLHLDMVFYQTFEKEGGAWLITTNTHQNLRREVIGPDTEATTTTETEIIEPE